MDNIKAFIEKHIPVMNSAEKVYELFQGLGYKILSPSYHGKESYGLREKDKEFINKIYTISNYQKRFQIFLVELKNYSNAIIKNISLDFEKEFQYPFLVFTRDYRNYTFVLIEKIREDVGLWKRKIVRLNIDIENAFYTDKLVLSNIAIKDETSPAVIYKIIKEAFSVEKVSKLFFEDYKTIFFKIRNLLTKQNIPVKSAHEFTQQLLNRIMFIYFIDKKRWFKHSPRFMKWFWTRYLQEKKNKNITPDTFYSHWLKVLFLEAFNNRFSHPHYLPYEVREALQLAPYLNGGLFKRNHLDDLPVNLSDSFFEKIFNFFEKYNFTIREDLPLDVEVAVDPQMLGYVYESLANVAEEIYERQDLGIFYTPRIEVDFMCRRSLVEYLAKNTNIDKKRLYHFVFDEDKTKIEKQITLEEYENLEEALDNLSVIDPACGSGAFLVGMLNVLVELYKTIFRHLPDRHLTDYELKKRIVGRNLYGVDVMPWAVHSAELRLWLSLMIESDLTIEELKLEPLLPNLNLKLRVGDSLVQEIGGINLNLRDVNISPSIKRKLSELKREKEKFYNNDRTAKFKTEESIIHQELRIFNEIIDERIFNLQKKKQELESSVQIDMFETEKSKKQQEKLKYEKEKIEKEIKELIQVKEKLKEQKPFVWDIDFQEIFGEKGGFDIVIGNPPYVRQEKIAPPNKLQSEITNKDKKEYKEKLLKSVQTHFPFIKSIDKKSDYYIYFYFHGLALLNPKGTFCFITSNSWLDVGYGKDLQEFLLKYVPIIAIYDNQAKRSFEHASINTIIALFGPPNTKSLIPSDEILSHTVKFVMFKRPFEEVINTENLLKIETAGGIFKILKEKDFRVYAITQKELLEEGMEYKEETKKSFNLNIGKYTGNKWGGKYLRAPDIYFTILEKGKGKLVKLGDIAEVRRGFTTGANEFFYVEDLTDKISQDELKKIENLRDLKSIEEIKKKGLRIIKPSKWGKNAKNYKLFLIEQEFLKPVIKSPRELKTIIVREEDLRYKVLMCDKSKGELKNSFVLDYIKWGEKQKFHKRPTCASRKQWWKIGVKKGGEFLWWKSIGERYAFFWNKEKFFTDQRNYLLDSDYRLLLVLTLNSTLDRLFIEAIARDMTGAISIIELSVEIVKKKLTFIPSLYSNIRNIINNNSLFRRPIYSIFTELGFDPSKPIREQEPNPLPDRKALDDIIFDELGLTEEERKEVYYAVAELVQNRLKKARSV